MLKPTFQLALGQQLTMTPQLRQAIRLLQLSAQALALEIHTALERNIMLGAEDDPAWDSGEAGAADASGGVSEATFDESSDIQYMSAGGGRGLSPGAGGPELEA